MSQGKPVVSQRSREVIDPQGSPQQSVIEVAQPGKVPTDVQVNTLEKSSHLIRFGELIGFQAVFRQYFRRER